MADEDWLDKLEKSHPKLFALILMLSAIFSIVLVLFCGIMCFITLNNWSQFGVG